MKEKYGGIDVLVNNAAIAFKQVWFNNLYILIDPSQDISYTFFQL